MNIPPGIFKSYDIRGIYPSEFNEENIVPIIQAIYKLFRDTSKSKEALKIVLGRDMRISSPSLFKIACDTLISAGADIIDAGLVSTPSFYFTVFYYGYDAGIQISASHNPKEYNGLKIVKRDGNGLIKIGKTTGMADIKRMSMEGVKISSNQKGSITKKTGILEDEVKNSLKIVGNPQVKKFKIVADAANAMGGTYIDALFKVIPTDLIRMNFKLDGTFPVHQPDPLQSETLVDLQKRVVEEKADLGLAPDGDGDRLFFIDERGNIVPPSIITALVARDMLKSHKGEKIVYDVRYVITPKKTIEKNGGISIITKVGHAFITELLHQENGIFAGESSGHYFFRDTGFAESQQPVIMTVLKVMSEEGKKLSEIIEELKESYESGEINFKVTNAPEILDALRKEFSLGELSTLDGIAITMPDYRFNVRTSNTEPLLRLNIESEYKDKLEKAKEKILAVINSVAK
ncbi:MAG: hypothetical protein A2905_06000 [Candidatus Levybacteria bacterium RIFCSPLOWO2_01_FULL_36_10]|nr:MAG: hypothetical protein A2905_06000 [Candidatus Levybacteria bacterium RIFCSPLOWO2_01_FULL_36_10]